MGKLVEYNETKEELTEMKGNMIKSLEAIKDDIVGYLPND